MAFLLLALPAAQGAGTFSVAGFVDENLYQGNGMICMRFDGAGRLWVTEKQGRVLVFPPPSTTSATIGAPSVFANFSAQVNTDGERGMTGLALDPDFLNNRFVYVLFATPTDQRILRLTSNATFTAMVPGSEVILLQGLPNTNTVHKAGDMAFHPNDPHNLYVMIGDDGERTVVGNLNVYNGKILRISASDGKGLQSNPYYDGNVNSVASRVWSARYRNPFRFTFDPAAPIADVLYISENGDGTDRIARITKGADGGWDNMFTTSSGDGKRTIMETSAPSKTGIAIFRSGPFAPNGQPVLYNARYGSNPREVKRWTLTGANLDTLTPIAADGGAAFYSGYTEHDIVSFTTGPDGSLYYTDSGQGPSTGVAPRLGRFRFVGGTQPVANFTSVPVSGQSPLQVTFTDTSTAPSSTIASRAWDFGDGTTSTAANPVKTYAQPGVYTVQLTITNAQGLTHTKTATITVHHQTSVTLTGQIYDGRALPAISLASATELRFYQADGTTPLAVTGGTGANGNILPVATGGIINATFTAQIAGNALVVSAGESASDGVEAAFVGIPLSTTVSSQSAGANFHLSDTMLRGRALDTKGVPAPVDIGVSRGTAGSYYAFAGGRDFLGGSGIPASGVNHRIVADALGYYNVPIRTGGGNATFHLETSADTLTSSHGKVASTTTVNSGGTTVKNLTIGLYNGGTGEADLTGIAATPNVNFATQIQPLFTSYCAACHNAIASNAFGLNLEVGSAFSELVEKESAEAPGVKLVHSGSAARSYLMEKINSAMPQVGTSMRPGDPMPLAQQALIRDWINQLIPPNLDAPPEIDSALSKSGVVSAPLTYQITAINLPTSFGATNLPPGLTFNSTTGVISGTPTTPGTTNTIITATNGNGTDTETLVFTITAGPPPSITSALALSAPVNAAFTYTIVAANNPASYGATGLPAGLSINPTTGVISGTVTTIGVNNVTITATNANGTDTETLVISFVANLSLNKGATASSFQGGNEVAKGNDSDINTRWAAADGNFPQWWRVDLDQQKLVSRVDIKWFGGTGRSYRYRIEISNNDTDYTEVVDKTANVVPDFTTDTFTPVAARYVRITVTGSTAGFASFFDVSVFGTNIPPGIPGTLAFSGATYSVQEGSANTTAIITVVRTGGSSGAVGATVSATVGGTATTGADFTFTSTTLSWADGDGASKSFTIPILADSLAEGNETLNLALSSPTGNATLGTPTAATLTILDRPFDDWRSRVFGAQANSPDAQMNADFDKDGIINLLEYTLDSDPTAANTSAVPRAGLTPEGHLQITFTRNLDATGLTLRVQATDSLATGIWQAIATKVGTAAWSIAPGVTVTDNPVTGVVKITDSELIDEKTLRFLRLQVERVTD